MKITFKDSKDIDIHKLLNLYQSVGWHMYTKHPNKMMDMMKKALYVYSAWDENELIGLIRVIGDDVFVIYIQDILINPNYHNQGVGKALMYHVIEKYKHVRQIVLLTEDDLKLNDFYESAGMKKARKYKQHAYIKYNEMF